jgi:hypothetical protein
MRHGAKLLAFALLATSAVSVGAETGKPSNREIGNYAAKVLRLVSHALYRQSFSGSGNADLKFVVCRSGKPQEVEVRTTNKEMRAFVYQHVLVTRFPKPPPSFPDCVHFTTPVSLPSR